MKNALKTIVLSAGFVLGSSICLGLGRYSTFLLPDDGNGSQALGFMDYSEDTCFFFGSKTQSNGRVVPMAWDLDNDGLVIDTAQLPLAAGLEGEAIGGRELSNGEIIVVGNVHGSSGIANNAVLWRRSVLGTWSGPEDLAPAFPKGIVLNVPDVTIVGTSTPGAVQNESGVWRPVIFEVGPGGTNIRMLPCPAGRDGFATRFRSDANSAVAGQIEDANGAMVPSAWYYDQSWSLVQNAFPPNIPGSSTDLAIDEGLWVVGWCTVGGNSNGFVRDNEGNLNLLMGLEGMPSSSATTIMSLGDTGTHEVGHIVGWSSSGDATQTSTTWINRIPYETRLLLDEPGNVYAVTTFGWDLNNDGQWAASQVMTTAGAPGHAAALQLTSEAPVCAVDIVYGQSSEDQEVDLSLFWDADNQAFSLGTRTLAGRNSMAVFDATYNPSPRSIISYEWDFNYNFVGRGSGGRTGGTMFVTAFCDKHSKFEPIGSFPLGSSTTSRSIHVTESSAHSYHHPESGAVRMRNRYVQSGSARGTLVVDKAAMDVGTL